MAIKIVQTVGILTTSAATSASTPPIVMKTGYIRVSTGDTGAFVAIGTGAAATRDSFHIPPYSAEIIKESLKRHGIVGITTGATTTVTFGQNLSNNFEVGEYVTIENASPAGINTSHVEVLFSNNSSVILDYNSSSVTNVSVNGSSTLVKSVKVSALSQGVVGEVSVCEVVQLVTE